MCKCVAWTGVTKKGGRGVFETMMGALVIEMVDRTDLCQVLDDGGLGASSGVAGDELPWANG